MKFRYLIIGEDWDAEGTNDADLARKIADEDFGLVVDVERGVFIGAKETLVREAKESDYFGDDE